jgi:hypothetical protein
MRYLDTVQLVATTPDGYGDRTATVLTDAGALFIQRASVIHNGNADGTGAGITYDASVYLDPQNPIVANNLDKLEGMYIVFGGWYRVAHVIVARRKLLNNAIDNIHCLLEKEPGVTYDTHVS